MSQPYRRQINEIKLNGKSLVSIMIFTNKLLVEEYSERSHTEGMKIVGSTMSICRSTDRLQMPWNQSLMKYLIWFHPKLLDFYRNSCYSHRSLCCSSNFCFASSLFALCQAQISSYISKIGQKIVDETADMQNVKESNANNLFF